MVQSRLEVVLEARNLTSPAFQQLKKDLEASDVAVRAVSKSSQQAGQGIQAGFQQAGGAAKSFSDGVAQGLGVSLPLSVAAATTAVVGFGLNGVKSYADFEKAIRSTNSLLGQTGPESEKTFQAMSAQVRQLAVRMGVDAKGAAQSLYETISAGVTDPAQALKVLEVAAKASVGGLADQKVVVSALTSVMGGYKLGAEQAARISDVLSQTVNIGKLNYQELATTIGNVIPLGAAAGVSFESLGAAIATQTKSGISAGEATTNLRQIIQQYLKPTEQAAEISKALGLSFDATTLKTHGLKGALDLAAAAAGGDQEILARLFGSVEALNGVLALTGQNAETFGEDLKGIENSAGATDRAYEELNKSFARQMEEMQAKANDLKIGIGENLLPVAKDLLTWVDQVGQKLGAWPEKSPPPEQTERMRSLGSAAQTTADGINAVVGAFKYLDDHIRASNQSGASPQALGAALANLGKARFEAARATDAYADAESRLTAIVTAGGEGAKEAEKQLAALRAGVRGVTDAQLDHAEAQELATQGLLDGTQASALAAVKAAEAAVATQEQANATAQTAQAEVKAAQATGQSAKEKIAAYEAAQKAAKDAAAAAKQAADRAIAEEKRHAEEVQRALATATETRRKYVEDIRDVETDGLARIQDIRDRHDTDYNQAIIAASDQQRDIRQKAADDIARVEVDAARKLYETHERLDTLTANADEAAVDRRLQLERRAADQLAAERERAAERQLRIEREAEDRRLREAEIAEDRRLAAEERAAQRRQEEQDAQARKKEVGDDATAQVADARKRHDREVADSKRKLDADSAEETTRHERELRDENIRHQRALRDADTDAERAREEERHADALQKEDERHGDATRKLAERAAEEQRARDEAFKDAEEKAKAKADADTKRIDAELAKRKAAQEEADRKAAETQKRQDDRQEASRALAARRREDDEKAADQRATAARDLQQQRETEDWNTRRRRAENDLRKAIADTETKRAEDIKAIEARREKDITASNDALVKKQAQIDAARDTDFTKFQGDLQRRFRDMEQQFSASMGKLSGLIPDRVAALMGGAAGNLAAASANLTAASTLTKGATRSGEGYDWETDADVAERHALGFKWYGEADGWQMGDHWVNPANYSPSTEESGQYDSFDSQPQEVRDAFIAEYGDNASAVWHMENEANQGRGAARPPAGDEDTTFATLRPTTGLAAILARLHTATQATNRLVGGDAFTLSDRKTPVSPTVTAAAGGTASNSNAISYAMARVGAQEWNGACQRFVENAHGTSGRYRSAKDAAAALITNAGGGIDSAPRGALVFFRPDRSNDYWGHVGISLGGGQFVSATYQGVQVDGPTKYWSGLYQGYGTPRFALGGVVPGYEGEERQATVHGGEVVLRPDQARALGLALNRTRADNRPSITVNLHVAGHVQTEQDLVRAIGNGLKDLQRRGWS